MTDPSERPLQPKDKDDYYCPSDADPWGDWLRADPGYGEWLDRLNEQFDREFGEEK